MNQVLIKTSKFKIINFSGVAERFLLVFQIMSIVSAKPIVGNVIETGRKDNVTQRRLYEKRIERTQTNVHIVYYLYLPNLKRPPLTTIKRI